MIRFALFFNEIFMKIYCQFCGFDNAPALYSVILAAPHIPYHLLTVGFIIHGLFEILFTIG